MLGKGQLKILEKELPEKVLTVEHISWVQYKKRCYETPFGAKSYAVTLIDTSTELQNVYSK